MVSENEFELIRSSPYRGSRYSNFIGSGIDPQGNVSSVNTENAATQLGTATDTNAPAPGTGLVTTGLASPGLTGSPSQAIQAPPSFGQAATKAAIGAGVPYAGFKIGSSVGSSLALGGGAGEGFKAGIGGLANKVSGGLIGAASSPTNAALASMGGKFGPATSSAVGKAASGSGIGGSIGAGLGTAAATLLTGGSVKDAAISGFGSAAGTYLGAAVGGPVGAAIGGFLGGNIGSIFGGGVGRQSVGFGLQYDPATKQYATGKVGTKGVDQKKATTLSNSLAGYLNANPQYNIGQGFGVRTNVGSKDKGTWVVNLPGQAKGTPRKVSGQAGDMNAVISYIQNILANRPATATV